MATEAERSDAARTNKTIDTALPSKSWLTAVVKRPILAVTH